MSFYPPTSTKHKKWQTCEISKNVKNVIISVLFWALRQVCFKMKKKCFFFNLKDYRLINYNLIKKYMLLVNFLFFWGGGGCETERISYCDFLL